MSHGAVIMFTQSSEFVFGEVYVGFLSLCGKAPLFSVYFPLVWMFFAGKSRAFGPSQKNAIYLDGANASLTYLPLTTLVL